MEDSQVSEVKSKPHTPLKITKELLKPWSPCSDGYRWFIAKFPQGEAYTAVQKALRDDKRFDDARWLTDKVWNNLILDQPQTTADVTANHDAEALDIIASTAAIEVNVPANGKVIESDGGKDDAQIGSSGYGARIGSSGNDAQIGSSGNGARIGSSGNDAQIGSSGYGARIGSSGYDAQIGSSGNDARIGSSGYGAQIGSSGNGARIGSSGNDAQINAEGTNAVIACAGLHNRAKAGANGALALAWADEAAGRIRIAVGYVGESLKADTWYEIKAGKFVEVAQ